MFKTIGMFEFMQIFSAESAVLDSLEGVHWSDGSVCPDRSASNKISLINKDYLSFRRSRSCRLVLFTC